MYHLKNTGLMKKVLFYSFLAISLSLTLISCEATSDSDEIILEKNGTTIGHWNLTNISGGFMGINQDYEPRSVVWDFNNRNTTLNIEHNIKSVIDILKPGNYHYYILDNKGYSYLYIEEFEFGQIVREKNKLIIDQNKRSSGYMSDGYILTFER